MMGLSWECEPALQKTVAHYSGEVVLCDRMGVLVRDVADLMMPDELALPEVEGIEAYNKRLAKIYLDEVSIGGVPMNMEGFRLFCAMVVSYALRTTGTSRPNGSTESSTKNVSSLPPQHMDEVRAVPRGHPLAARER